MGFLRVSGTGSETLGQSEVLILHLGGGLEELTPCGKILELRQLATKLAEPKAWRVMNVED